MKTKGSKAKGKRAVKVKDLTIRKGQRVKGGFDKYEHKYVDPLTYKPT